MQAASARDQILSYRQSILFQVVTQMSKSKPSSTIIGALASPFVRKVLAICELKGIPYAVDPILPFFGDDRFSRMNPLRRIPIFVDDQVTLADSSVICQYLEDRYPEPRAYPEDIGLRAHARWLEEYADTRFTDVCIWKIFYPAVVKPGVFGAARDLDAIQKAASEDLPEVFGYLEGEAPERDFRFGGLSIADISLAVHMRNLHWARIAPPAGIAPKALAWLGRVETHPALARLNEAAVALMRTPIPGHRDLLGQLGFTVAADSIAGPEARRGPMTL
jgi:glutathione S-transferase